MRVRFVEADDEPRIPSHWRTFTSRRSTLTRAGAASRASTPVNAMLNYLYAILEAEARIACLTVGLDPGLGVLHTDRRNRDSLALDIMEPVRPHVDSWLLAQIRRHRFHARDFGETPEGVCRIRPQLASLLAGTANAWAVALAPYAAYVADTLAGKPQASNAISAMSARYYAPKLPDACHKCGITLQRHRATICTECDRKRRCRECDLPLTGRKSTAEVCDRRCRNRQTAQRKRETRHAQRANTHCRQCGATLTAKPPNATYCTTRCKTRAYNQRKRVNLNGAP